MKWIGAKLNFLEFAEDRSVYFMSHMAQNTATFLLLHAAAIWCSVQQFLNMSSSKLNGLSLIALSIPCKENLRCKGTQAVR